MRGIRKKQLNLSSTLCTMKSRMPSKICRGTCHEVVSGWSVADQDSSHHTANRQCRQHQRLLTLHSRPPTCATRAPTVSSGSDASWRCHRVHSSMSIITPAAPEPSACCWWPDLVLVPALRVGARDTAGE
jgi:hypothetical protein